MDETDKIAEEKETEVTPKEHRFTKEQLLNSVRYSGRKDALSVLLEEKKTYTHKEVELVLNKFLKKKVK